MIDYTRHAMYACPRHPREQRYNSLLRLQVLLQHLGLTAHR